MISLILDIPERVPDILRLFPPMILMLSFCLDDALALLKLSLIPQKSELLFRLVVFANLSSFGDSEVIVISPNLIFSLMRT